jgi:hypothetical protein
MKLHKQLLILANVSLLVPLLAHGYYGSFSRYLADDFCTASQFKAQGFISSMLYWRMTWSGRYSFIFFINIAHFIGQWITPYLTLIVIILWLFVLFVFIRQIFHVVGIPYAVLPIILLACIVLYSTLNGTPDLYQSLYWHTGLLTYVVPLLFLTGYGAIALNRISNNSQTSWGGLGLSAGITFVAGGFSETYVALQVVAVLAFLTTVYIFLKGEARCSGILFLSAGLFGAIVSIILVITAPGNFGRLSFMPDPLAFAEVVYLALRDTLLFSKLSIYNNPLSSIIALLIPGLLALYLPLRKNRQESFGSVVRDKFIPFLIGIPILAYILIAATLAPSYYATGVYPAERALITSQFVLIIAFISWSLLAGIFLRRYFVKDVLHSPLIMLLIVVLLISGAYNSSQKTLSGLPEAQIYANLWDARDDNIRQEVASGAQEISAASLPHMSPGLAELSADPNDWINRCLASYYGLSKVFAK